MCTIQQFPEKKKEWEYVLGPIYLLGRANEYENN